MNDINDKYTHLLCFHVYLGLVHIRFLAKLASATKGHGRRAPAPPLVDLIQVDNARQPDRAGVNPPLLRMA